jgi:hypothetical protein
MKQTRQAVHAVKQSIFLCLCLSLYKHWDQRDRKKCLIGLIPDDDPILVGGLVFFIVADLRFHKNFYLHVSKQGILKGEVSLYH